MKWISGRRPSPAMIVALIAMFVSLSGVSYGVATGFIDSREIKNNEVRSIDIRNNQIRTRDLRNNEVRGIDIRNSTVQGRDVALNTLTGVDIREDSLGKVPLAGAADTAASATTAASADSVRGLHIIPVTAVAAGGQPAVLASHGPLTLYGECGPGGVVTSLSVSTTREDSAAAGNTSNSNNGGGTGFTNPDLDASDGRFRVAEVAPGMDPRWYAVTTVSALAPNGSGFNGAVAMYKNTTTAPSCRFHGSLALQG